MWSKEVQNWGDQRTEDTPLDSYPWYRLDYVSHGLFCFKKSARRRPSAGQDSDNKKAKSVLETWSVCGGIASTAWSRRVSEGGEEREEWLGIFNGERAAVVRVVRHRAN